jgi:tRNA pseudouridine55 synthase
LDPAAEGVLVLCLGRATKLVESVMDQPKVYRARARLDVTSESFDSDRPLVDVPVERVPLAVEVAEALAAFEGTIEQVPPTVSAVKIGGVPSYKLNRGGQPVELKARAARIYWITLHHFDWPVVEFEMACGRGTYVRSLIRDVGLRLGTGGCLTGLTRTRVGPFGIEEAHTLKALEAASGPTAYLLPVERAKALLDRRPMDIPPRAAAEEPLEK